MNICYTVTIRRDYANLQTILAHIANRYRKWLTELNIFKCNLMTKNGKQDADVPCSIAPNGENFPLERIDDKKG